MTTITIDIPDQQTDEVIALLKEHGVIVRESALSDLDTLTKEDYQKHFKHRAKLNAERMRKKL